MSTRLTLTPHRCRNPRKNHGIPTIPAGHLDGGTANVSTVDTELPTGSTPRGLAWSQWWDRAPSTQVLPHDSISRMTCLDPRMRGADLSPFRDDIVPGPSTPACAGLTARTSRSVSVRALYPRVRGADTC